MANENIREAQESYNKFIGMTKVGVVVVAIIVAFVVFLISR